MAAGLRARLIAGFGTLTTTFALSTLLQILAVPVFVRSWGTELYGEWLAIGAASGLFSILDLGLQVHLTNLMRVAAARGERREIERLMAAGLGLYAAVILIGAALLAAVLLAGGVAARGRFSDPDAGLAFLLLTASTLLLLPRGLVGGVFSARGQMARETLLGSAAQLIPVAAQLAVAMSGGGLAAAAVATLLAGIVAGWGFLLLGFRRCHPDISLGLRWPGAGELRRYLRKSALHSVPGAAIPLLLHVPVLALQSFNSGGSAVVAFTTMRTFAGFLRQIMGQAVVALVLEMVRQHAQTDRRGFLRLFQATGRLVGGAVGLIAALLFALGPPFFMLWTHGAVAFDPWLGAVLIGIMPVMAPGLCCQTLLRHTDHAEPLARAAVVQTLAGIALLPVLVPAFGAFGAGAAVATAELLGPGWGALRAAARIFGFDALETATRSWGGALAGFGLGAAAAAPLLRLLAPVSLAGMAGFSALWMAVLAPLAPYLLLSPEQRAPILRLAFRPASRVWSRLRRAG